MCTKSGSRPVVGVAEGVAEGLGVGLAVAEGVAEGLGVAEGEEVGVADGEWLGVADGVGDGEDTGRPMDKPNGFPSFALVVVTVTTLLEDVAVSSANSGMSSPVPDRVSSPTAAVPLIMATSILAT